MHNHIGRFWGTDLQKLIKSWKNILKIKIINSHQYEFNVNFTAHVIFHNTNFSSVIQASSYSLFLPASAPISILSKSYWCYLQSISSTYFFKIVPTTTRSKPPFHLVCMSDVAFNNNKKSFYLSLLQLSHRKLVITCFTQRIT